MKTDCDIKMAQALAAYAAGKFVIVVDDQERENEGDLVISAEKVTVETIAFMIRHTTGIICVSLPAERLHRLGLPLMVPDNTESQQTAFTVSVDASHGTSTGVSASDRVNTIRALVHPNTTPNDLRRPGHVFPLKYCQGGVLKRAGHTEAAVDLAKLCGMSPAGVIAEVVNDNGSMARLPE
ncbi:MAG: 3,4-dihydroxy-2-butanone-4-phosphate synthase, partial [Waddliaceae bacterium]